jgi:type IV secretion system protein VirD4
MSERDEPPVPLAALLVTAVVLAAFAWFIPAVVVLISDRQPLRCSPGEAVGGTFRLVADARWSDPASAYPARVREQMPEAAVWWTTTAVVVALLVVCGVAAVRRLEPQVARERLGRRPYDWRGARPRSWARGRDLSELSGRRNVRGFTVGSIDGRRLRTDEEAHVAVIAPTRSGKTTRCVIPWLLEHEGPAIVTSTKRDVLQATRGWRERHGRVWVYDPFAEGSACWDPVDGCKDWSHALRQAQWLADATQDGDSEVASYWRGEAAKLLAPLVHAAALDDRPIDDVIGWLDTQEAREPAALLKASGALPAAKQLRSVIALDPRNRGTTFMSAGSVLSAYRFPPVLATARRGVSPKAFFDGAPNTLYLVASERDQRLLAPLVVGLLSSLLHGAAERGPLGPALRVLVDEAANVAPLRDLPRFLSQAAGHGVRLATIWQSLGQMRERYGAGSDTILANSTAKLFMGPITDDATRRALTDLLGHDVDGLSSRRPASKAGAAALQQLAGDRALLVAGASPPAIVATRPWWRDRQLRVRAHGGPSPVVPIGRRAG